MINIGYPYYFFGSPNSVDIDVLVHHPDTTGTANDERIVKTLEEEFSVISHWNLSLIKITDGIISETMQRRGSPDAVHNSLFYTYRYHDQVFENPLKAPVNRHLLLAVHNCVRTLLAITGATNQKPFYKAYISPILRDGKWEDEVAALSLLNYNEPFFDQSERNIGLIKSLAFDIGQTISLINGKEYYIKQEIIEQHKVIAPLINREVIDVNICLLPKISELQMLIKNMNIVQPERFIIQAGTEKVNTKFSTVLN